MKDYDDKTLMNFVRNNNIKTAEDLSTKFKQMYQDVIRIMLENEMSEQLGYDKFDRDSKNTDNSRNGHTHKKVRSTFGDLDIDIPRDRNTEFNPTIIPKHSKSLSKDIENNIISMYGRGMTTRDVSDQVKEIYGISLSAESISRITEDIMENAKEWQARPLNSVYPFLFLDAIHYSVRTDGKVVKRAAYVVLGINLDGIKDVLGIYIGENESSKFWLSVLTNLKNRGVKDVFIASVDGLSGFPGAINSVFPQTKIQRCIVHQIRNSLKYVSWKDKKEFARNLKEVYTSSDSETGYDVLLKIEEKWKEKYSYVFKSWKENWGELSTFFDYTPEIRKIMYTTNAIESLNSQYRKVTKTKTVFPTDKSLLKALYLGTLNITKKWKNPIRNWTPILGQLSIEFENRF
jgi:transposase-like protein